MQPDTMFIDTGGIDLLVNPRDRRLIEFWKRFDKKERHFISHVVYWEYLRQFKPRGNSLSRQRFKKLVDRKQLEFLPFGEAEAELAVKIYIDVRRKLATDEALKSNLIAMQCDIMIAATAVRHRKSVLTQDVKDWALIKGIVEGNKLGTLPVSDQKDILAG